MKTTTNLAYWHAMIVAAVSLVPWWPAFGEVLTPGWGPPGTQVVVKIDGLDSEAVTAVMIGEVAAPITARGAGTVTISIPAGAASGVVTLSLGEEMITTPVSLEVTRLIPLNIGAGFSQITAGGSLFGDAVAGQVQVAVGRATLVFASNGGEGPALFGIVTDAHGSLTVDAATTAQAVVFLSSPVFTADSAEAVNRLQTLASLTELGALTATVETEVQAGRDYSALPEFGDALEAALMAYLALPTITPQPAWPDSPSIAISEAARVSSGTGGYVRRDLKAPGFEKLDRVTGTTHSEGLDESTGRPVLRQKFGSAPLPDVDLGKFLTANPLDSVANLYALNIGDSRLNTRAKALALLGNHSDVYIRQAPEALDRLVIASEPATRYIAVVDLVKNWLGKTLIGGAAELTGTATKSALNIPDDVPGLYMVRTFNGARFDRQDLLLDNLPGGRAEHQKMLAFNIVMAVNDSLAFIIGDQAIPNTDWAKNLIKLEKNIAGALEVQSAQGTLDSDAIKAIVLAATKTAFEILFDRARKAGISALPSSFGGLITVILKRVDQVAAAAKLVERVNAMTNAVQVFNDNVYTIQAVDDTLLIVGDPWGPVISGFHPQKGRRNDRVTITGTGFSSILEQNIVTIGYLGTSPDSPPLPVRAKVLEKIDNNLLIMIPEEANTGAITVHVTGKGTASTTALDPPFQQFEVIPDPVLFAMDPPEATPGQRVQLIGENFPPLENNPVSPKLYAVFTIGSESFEIPLSGSETELVVHAPFNVGTGTVRLRYGEQFGSVPRFSNAIAMAIIPSDAPAEGAEIRFSAAADNNVRDGVLTLREALMLKNGTLSYSSLTTEAPGDPAGMSYETDYVSSNAVGTGVRNRIVAYLTGGTHRLSLTAPLPPVVSWTTLEIRRVTTIGPAPYFILDGDGAATGIILDNARSVSVSGLHLEDFGSAAFFITGGSHDNLVRLCTVDGGTGHGVHMLTAAKRNLISVAVSGVGGDGYRLSGAGVVGNDITLVETPAGKTAAVENCGGWGIHIEEGAHLNRILAPTDAIFVAPPSGGIANNQLGGIFVTGAATTGNSIHQMHSIGLPIRDNGGPGIRIESPQTTVYLCRVTGNAGAGIEIFGAAAAGSRVGACSIGYIWETGAAASNGGHGIHVKESHDVQLGEEIVQTFMDVPVNGIAANEGHGIFIENSQAVVVRSSMLGRVPLENPDAPEVDLPNDLSGVVVTNSSDCILGSSWFRARLQVTGHLSGWGILMTGTGSHNNTIIGTSIGYDPFSPNTDLGNNVGIEASGGTWGNRIGMRGSAMNSIFHNRLAGVIIDAGIDPSQSVPPMGVPFAPRGATIVVNNSIQHQHEVGVLVSANSKATQIGGGAGEGNTISSNGKIGVKIDGATATRPELGNRVVGNTLFGNGIALAAVDPLVGEPQGINILLKEATRQRVGGNRTAEGNTTGNSWVGMMIYGGSDNFIGSNKISNCRKAGVLLRDTQKNLAGPNNEITDAGVAGFDPLGGLAISGGTLNRVVGNRIGSLRNGTARTVVGDGILVRESSNNQIGGHGSDGNLLHNATLYGLRITGAAATNNSVAGNSIGLNPGPGVAVQANAGGGIVMEAGASGNQIGASLPVTVNGAVALLPAANFISNNTGEGVRVAGAATRFNTITDNRISANGGLGIFLAGGNNNIEAPSLTAEPGTIEGTTAAPNGSLVQFFWDLNGEGGTPVGETTVMNGAFEFTVPPLLAHTQMTATVTSALTGDTSQFASPVTVVPPQPIGVHIARFGGAPIARAVTPGATTGILPLQAVVTGDAAVRLTRLDFDFTGTAAGALAQVMLYRDVNSNSVLDAADTLAAPALSDVSAGAEFTGSLAVVYPQQPERLLLVITVAADATTGQAIACKLPSVESVAATSILNPSPVAVSGTLPAISDSISVSGSVVSFDSWAGQYFTVAEMSSIGQPTADAEGDRMSNLLEYFVGTHPLQNDGSPLQITSEEQNSKVVFTHLERPDVNWWAEESLSLDSWGPLSFGTLQAPEPLGDGRVRETITFEPNGPPLFFRIWVEVSGP